MIKDFPVDDPISIRDNHKLIIEAIDKGVANGKFDKSIPATVVSIPSGGTCSVQLFNNGATIPGVLINEGLTVQNGDQVWIQYIQNAPSNFLIDKNVSHKGNGCIFTSTADATVTNTNIETTIIGTGVGNLTLPANFLKVGRTVKIRLYGIHTVPSSPPTLNIKFKLNSTIVSQTGAMTDKNDTNTLFWIDCSFTCRSVGASGAIRFQGAMIHQETTDSVNVWDMGTTANTTIDTTIAQTIGITATWSAINATTSITGTNTIIEVLN